MTQVKKKGFLGKIFNPKWDVIANQVINLIFLFFGNKLKGYRTVILNTTTAIVGALLAFMAKPTMDFICSLGVEQFCGGENSEIAGYIMIIVGLLNNILRKVTGDDAEVAAYRVTGSSPTNKPVKWIAVASLFALIATIILLIV